MNPADAMAVHAPVADMSLLGLFLQAHFVVKVVMVGLLSASVWCWAIIVDKTLLFRRTKAEMDAFEDAFWSGRSLEELFRSFNDRPATGLAAVFVAASFAAAFFAGALLAGVFLAGELLAGTLVAGVFVAGAFFATSFAGDAFFAASLAGAVVTAAFSAGAAFFAGAAFVAAFAGATVVGPPAVEVVVGAGVPGVEESHPARASATPATASAPAPSHPGPVRSPARPRRGPRPRGCRPGGLRRADHGVDHRECHRRGRAAPQPDQ